MYLTADSPNTITDLDPTDVYIIGGLVDRNRHVGITLNRANKQGIRHGKLPITDYVKLSFSCVLTVNQVFDIIAYQHNYQDWRISLDKVIPSRKIIAKKYEDNVVVLNKT